MENFTTKGAGLEKAIYDKVDPKDMGSLQRIVLAGQKVMFSKETHKYMQQMLAKERDLADKLGMGIVELMGLLFQQSKGNIPPQLIIPAGAILLIKAGEFIERTEGGMDMAVYSEAVKLMTAGINKQMTDMVNRAKQGQPEQMAGQMGQAGEAQPPVPQQPPQRGLLNAQGGM